MEVVRVVYGPAVRDAICTAAEAVGLVRAQLDTLDRERAALTEALAKLERGFSLLVDVTRKA